jgi:hypothetical protein
MNGDSDIMGNTRKAVGKTSATPGAGSETRLPEISLGVQVTQALRPLTPLLAAAAFAVTAMTLVGSLLMV